MTMKSEMACYTLINTLDDGDLPTEQTLQRQLEKADVNGKIAALKKTIQLLLHGEKMPSLLMTIIRFVMPLKDHTIKKLLLLYWEIVPKKTPQGKLLHEMILVCDAYRRDLLHPNEFVRGSTLRFLCKLKEPELLEPLLPSIRQCLEHRHSYVRRNAVMAIFTVYKNFEFLLPDAPELIYTFLCAEQDMSCKRNAFIMLITADQERALDYLADVLDQVGTFGDIMQLVIVELVQRVCRTTPSERGRFIRCIYALLNSSSAAVRYEAAHALISLSSAPTAVRAAVLCYVDLVTKESDNNVKLIVLDRLNELHANPAHERLMQDLVMDVVRLLFVPDLDVRSKVLDLVLELVSQRNVNDVVAFLQKEIRKTLSSDNFDRNAEYRQVLVRAMHACGVKFPAVAVVIVPVLMDFLGDTNAASASDVVLFVREAMQRFPDLRSEILTKLLESFPQIKTSHVFRAVLWILGEYASGTVQIEEVASVLDASLGELPIVESELRALAGDDEDAEGAGEKEGSKAGTAPAAEKRLVNPDGTYATQSALTSGSPSKASSSKGSGSGGKGAGGMGGDKVTLRSLVLDGDLFLGSVLSSALTKLALRHREGCAADGERANKFSAHTLLVMASVAHVARSGLHGKHQPGDGADSLERIMLCVRVVAERDPMLIQTFEEECREAYASILEGKDEESESSNKAQSNRRRKGQPATQPDDLITFRQLRDTSSGDAGAEDEFELSLSRATGAGETISSAKGSKLNKVFQLTGFSDPVYAEAYVNVNQYDISLDVLVVNQTADTLHNLNLELATLGDLKLVERPGAYTLGAHDFCNINANIKVSSTETGIIFGNIVYDVSGQAAERNCVVLDDVHIDVMDYITPGNVNEDAFRDMWQEFEWENKVGINTNYADLNEYLEHVLKTTNMRCLTPEKALQGDCGFLAANLYAKSVFGEDALANLSAEITPDGKLVGHIRIRSKTQGIALSLGDKITHHQKKVKA